MAHLMCANVQGFMDVHQSETHPGLYHCVVYVAAWEDAPPVPCVSFSYHAVHDDFGNLVRVWPA